MTTATCMTRKRGFKGLLLGFVLVCLGGGAAWTYTYSRPIPTDGIVSLAVERQYQGKPYRMLWLRDQESDLALGINEGDFKDANFGTRIHDSNGGPKEYSCYPDDVVFVSQGGVTKQAYAGYLKWNHSSRISEDGKVASSTYSRRGDMGLFDTHIEKEFLSRMADVQAAITVHHELRRGRPYVKTTVRVRSEYAEPVHMWWVYQDGVFLNLPRQNQLNVMPISQTTEGVLAARGALEDPWVGLADLESGIASVIYSPQAKHYFVLPHYLGVRGFPIQGCQSRGVNCHFGGNDRFEVVDGEVPLMLSNFTKGGVPRPSTPQDLKIQGVAFDLGDIAPQEEREISFYRLAVSGERSVPAIRARVGAMVKDIADGR